MNENLIYLFVYSNYLNDIKTHFITNSANFKNTIHYEFICYVFDVIHRSIWSLSQRFRKSYY